MNKRGFTLVELLAVIVILAIIALIVTPVVNNIITSARTSANARSVEGHIRNVELAIITEAFTKETGDLTLYDVTNGNIPTSLVEKLPNNDIVFCAKYTIENGTVLSASDCVSNINNWNKSYSYTNTAGAKVTGANNILVTLVAPNSGATHKGIVYIDPTDLSVECTSTSAIDATSTTGCKKFYIYNDESNTYKLIMDRNLGTNVRWVSKNAYLNAGGVEADWGTEGNTSLGAISANAAMVERTTGWIGNPRMITADEVAHIVGADLSTTIKWDSKKLYGTNNTSTQSSWFYLDGGYNSNPTVYEASSNGWQKQYATSTGASNYVWLFDYLYNCNSYGCINKLDNNEMGSGYWTNTAVTGTNQHVWLVNRQGWLIATDSVNNGITSTVYGIRPVIELPKALINS